MDVLASLPGNLVEFFRIRLLGPQNRRQQSQGVRFRHLRGCKPATTAAQEVLTAVLTLLLSSDQAHRCEADIYRAAMIEGRRSDSSHTMAEVSIYIGYSTFDKAMTNSADD